ncbi:hypothetical protein J6590_027241 [Homalodisca vitripennis]|nr:hypothetical protein J6590_027241 [Homalodisca vitripennis]
MRADKKQADVVISRNVLLAEELWNLKNRQHLQEIGNTDLENDGLARPLRLVSEKRETAKAVTDSQ